MDIIHYLLLSINLKLQNFVELYCFQLPAILEGISFDDFVLSLYVQFNMILLGVYDDRTLRINPMSTTINSEEGFILKQEMIAIVMTTNVDVIQEVLRNAEEVFNFFL